MTRKKLLTAICTLCLVVCSGIFAYAISVQYFGKIGNGCAGAVTLSGGAGTFTNACVAAADYCLCVDTTAAAACKTVPAAGSAAITGTTTDVIDVMCFTPVGGP